MGRNRAIGYGRLGAGTFRATPATPLGAPGTTARQQVTSGLRTYSPNFAALFSLNRLPSLMYRRTI